MSCVQGMVKASVQHGKKQMQESFFAYSFMAGCFKAIWEKERQWLDSL